MSNVISLTNTATEQEQEQAAEVVAIAEPETIQPIDCFETVQAIAVEPYFVHAALANCNKNSHLSEYSQQVSDGDYRTQLYQVRWHVHLTSSQYKSLGDGNLLTDFDWLAGKGGTDSTTAPREVDDWFEYTAAEQEQWIKGAYDICLLVISPIGKMVIDPQGHNYARYVGIDITPLEATEAICETIPEAIAPQIEPEIEQPAVTSPMTIETVLYGSVLQRMQDLIKAELAKIQSGDLPTEGMPDRLLNFVVSLENL